MYMSFNLSELDLPELVEAGSDFCVNYSSPVLMNLPKLGRQTIMR